MSGDPSRTEGHLRPWSNVRNLDLSPYEPNIDRTPIHTTPFPTRIFMALEPLPNNNPNLDLGNQVNQPEIPPFNTSNEQPFHSLSHVVSRPSDQHASFSDLSLPISQFPTSSQYEHRPHHILPMEYSSPLQSSSSPRRGRPRPREPLRPARYSPMPRPHLDLGNQFNQPEILPVNTSNEQRSHNLIHVVPRPNDQHASFTDLSLPISQFPTSSPYEHRPHHILPMDNSSPLQSSSSPRRGRPRPREPLRPAIYRLGPRQGYLLFCQIKRRLIKNCKGPVTTQEVEVEMEKQLERERTEPKVITLAQMNQIQVFKMLFRTIERQVPRSDRARYDIPRIESTFMGPSEFTRICERYNYALEDMSQFTKGFPKLNANLQFVLYGNKVFEHLIPKKS